jgi:hypothetical protein
LCAHFAMPVPVPPGVSAGQGDDRLAARVAAGPLTSAIAAQPLNRQDRKRTSGRTPAERRKWPTEEADYDLTIVPSNLPKADTSPRT